MTRKDNAARRRAAMAQVAKVAAILRRWDPIGIAPGAFAPGDEYDDYAPRLVSLVLQGGDADALCRRLEHFRVDVIGVERDPAHDRAIAEEILRALRQG